MEHDNQQRSQTGMPATPLTLDGSYLLHQMFRVRWSAWKALGHIGSETNLRRAATMFVGMEQKQGGTERLFSLLGPQGRSDGRSFSQEL